MDEKSLNLLLGQLPSPYRTKLGMSEDIQYQAWRAANDVPDENTGFSSEYDMPGFYQEQNQDGIVQRLLGAMGSGSATEMKSDGLHYPDTYKTPFHPTTSNESKYKLPGMNREWMPNKSGGWDLIDLDTGAIIKTDNG